MIFGNCADGSIAGLAWLGAFGSNDKGLKFLEFKCYIAG